jgi:hypothetical protein
VAVISSFLTAFLVKTIDNKALAVRPSTHKGITNLQVYWQTDPNNSG